LLFESESNPGNTGDGLDEADDSSDEEHVYCEMWGRIGKRKSSSYLELNPYFQDIAKMSNSHYDIFKFVHQSFKQLSEHAMQMLNQKQGARPRAAGGVVSLPNADNKSKYCKRQKAFYERK
jgi:hypothetical protein